jgi:hypothetical protein
VKASKVSIILASTALAVALFAATPLSQAAGRLVLAKNSVGTAQLKRNAVTAVKVKDGSLLATDFKAGQLPAGPQGPQGSKGDPGARGPIGPSDGFVASTLGPISIVGSTTLKSLTLPAGKYVIVGRAELLSTQLQIIRCRFYPSGTAMDAAATVDPGTEESLTVTDTESLSGPTTVSLRCNSAYNATAYEPVVTAIKVGTLTNQ